MCGADFMVIPTLYHLVDEGEIPYVDMELRNSLINFYSDLAEAYNL